MKKKIVGILVMTLLISAGTIVVADWDEDDGHKMHYPQLPDPYGFDVDFGYWEMGDDWQCSETGTVDDIHFWISWFTDQPMDIPWIKCSIWSNEPNGPHGYSIPRDILWEKTFFPGEFIIAGPWDGEQRWFMPWGEIIPEYHYLYWQVNIPAITDPFLQQEDEIYWLIVDMPFDVEFWVGWKNTKDYFMDHAVWRPPGGDWLMIDGIDFAFVITGEEVCNPSVDVEKYVWDPDNEDWVDADTAADALDLKICTDARFKIVIHNNGECCDLTNIKVVDKMHDSLKYISADPEPDEYYYEPPEYFMKWNFPGPLEPCNTIEIIITAHVEGPGCSTDYNYVEVIGHSDCEPLIVTDDDWAYVHAKKGRSVDIPFLSFLQNFLENHPNLFPILRLLLQRLGLQ